MNNYQIDVVVAVRNEEENIPIFVEKIKKLSTHQSVQLCIIFVEDGSTDKTLELLRTYSLCDPNIGYYSLKEGFGQTAAIAFGIQQSTADAVIMMDVDGGHPVDTIVDMVDHFNNGADIVQAVRMKSEERRWYRNSGTFIFNLMFYVIAGIDTEKQNVYYRLISKKVKQMFLSNKRWLYFLRMNFSPKERLNIQYVFFDSKSRQYGKSKYSIIRLVKLAIIAPLSVMSTKRFFFILSVLCVILFFLFLNGGILGIVALFGIEILLIYQFWKMSTVNILSKLETKEHNESSKHLMEN